MHSHRNRHIDKEKKKLKDMKRERNGLHKTTMLWLAVKHKTGGREIRNRRL